MVRYNALPSVMTPWFAVVPYILGLWLLRQASATLLQINGRRDKVTLRCDGDNLINNVTVVHVTASIVAPNCTQTGVTVDHAHKAWDFRNKS